MKEKYCLTNTNSIQANIKSRINIHKYLKALEGLCSLWLCYRNHTADNCIKQSFFIITTIIFV